MGGKEKKINKRGSVYKWVTEREREIKTKIHRCGPGAGAVEIIVGNTETYR